MVRVAALVALNWAVIVLRPPARVRLPIVSVELMSAVALLEAGSAPRKRSVPLASETGTVSATRFTLLLPAPVLSNVRLAAVTTMPAEASIEPCGPDRMRVPAVTLAVPVKVLALASVRELEPVRTRSPVPLTTPAKVRAFWRSTIERAVTAMLDPTVVAPPLCCWKRPPARTTSRVKLTAVGPVQMPKVPRGLTVIVPVPVRSAPWLPKRPCWTTMLPSVTVPAESQKSPKLTLVRVKPPRSSKEPIISARK